MRVATPFPQRKLTEQSGYVAARLLTGTTTCLRALLGHGTPTWKGGTSEKVEGSKGLLQILEPVRVSPDFRLEAVPPLHRHPSTQIPQYPQNRRHQA